jgi:hypothetical protein
MPKNKKTSQALTVEWRVSDLFDGIFEGNREILDKVSSKADRADVDKVIELLRVHTEEDNERFERLHTALTAIQTERREEKSERTAWKKLAVNWWKFLLGAATFGEALALIFTVLH